MNYCKIKAGGRAEMMPNPYRVSIANPTDTQKGALAVLGGYLEMVYTEPPEYDPSKQFVSSKWEEQDGKAVQVWTVHDIPVPIPPLNKQMEE